VIPAAVACRAPLALPYNTPLLVKVAAPEPPWVTLRAVVRPAKLVMSLLDPRAAAPRLVRAPTAVAEPVPPEVIAKGLVKVRLVKVGLATVFKLPQLPPLPRVIVPPPPDKLPVPLAHVSVVLPCTAVLATLP